MGPSRCFGRTHQRNPDPIWNHLLLLWRDQWTHSGGLAGLTKEILGPYKIIGHFCDETNGPTGTQMLRQDSPKKSWAHMKSSATSVEGSMDPLRWFGRTHRRNFGPMRNHRPLLWRDQWAHSDASARLTEEILGPCEIIGHFCEEINGPTQMLRQNSPKKFWAHMKSSATSVEGSMDPLRCLGRTHRRNPEPIRNHRPLL
jgi:hypothetical protein